MSSQIEGLPERMFPGQIVNMYRSAIKPRQVYAWDEDMPVSAPSRAPPSK